MTKLMEPTTKLLSPTVLKSGLSQQEASPVVVVLVNLILWAPLVYWLFQ